MNGFGITAAKGFRAVGVHAGIKKEHLDLGIVVSDVPAAAAGVFTLNRVRAACVQLNESVVQNGILQAIVVNSGNANACTGAKGWEDAQTMQAVTADQLGIPAAHVAVASTGVIGVELPMEQVQTGIKAACREAAVEGFETFAKAITTTDTCLKQYQATVNIEGKQVTIGGAVKGSGMIHPNMATMLGFLTTDAAVGAADLQQLLRDVTNESFNMITVDGDTSTNDMVLVMANGQAGTSLLSPEHPDWPVFAQAFQDVAVYLAKSIARDGEGATKLVEARVHGAKSVEDARKIAKAIIGSNLVKTAVYGADANWGRILCAVGYAGVDIVQESVDIWLGNIPVAKKGMGIPFDEEAAKEYLLGDPVVIKVDLGLGEAAATAYGCDLTYDYVKINASYRS
ncbi:bifunctional glutamate N-acetyltransferase/amino-acid acetyltransferase ArgJ [Fodinisporobacter ferrooxydans]|uniref:Arginine biosynthesis bifunctional protein ArgJ n=2 Tax=Fodinisporobacter ferrooxydans TaxID=2901836 RepID=A0ABY4CU34_9BACL|nr:bifunctional glutamate N-acetyltransferase/amino-acid acetyltransferase ArgJ [Alicyclobacillaceae bacterium MYW30-H2]